MVFDIITVCVIIIIIIVIMRVYSYYALQCCKYADAWYVTQEDENNDKVVKIPSLERFKPST